MNFLHLKYVISIAENGSINKAAEELHVAQPNLSRVVKELEADLGIQFFRRSSKGMLLTPDGELLADGIIRYSAMTTLSRRISKPDLMMTSEMTAARYASRLMPQII